VFGEEAGAYTSADHWIRRFLAFTVGVCRLAVSCNSWSLCRPEKLMPRPRSLIARVYEAHRKAKLQRQKLEDQAGRAWAEEEGAATV
jgi:hypothetical protein